MKNLMTQLLNSQQKTADESQNQTVHTINISFNLQIYGLCFQTRFGKLIDKGDSDENHSHRMKKLP